MVPTNGRVILVATLVALVGAGAVPSVAAQTGQSTPQQGSPGTCDYEELYDQTIDSVVSVQTGAGLGSGFVYGTGQDDVAYVVTNAHVVQDASSVAVQFASGDLRDGSVVGEDALADLAVIRVPDAPADVTSLSLIDDRPEHGQAVAALGNPFGLEETVTHGIVSGLNRSMPTQLGFSIPDVVQTDAPISSGNSGGPLVTCDGRVVGVNTAGIAASGAENIGFAISASIVEEVAPELIETGEFDHPFLGVQPVPIGPEVAAAYGLADARGVAIGAVQPDVPAADDLQGATGVETVGDQRVPVGGDVLLAINGTAVDSPEDLSSTLLTQTEPGQPVELTVLRDGEVMSVNTTVTERPEPELR